MRPYLGVIISLVVAVGVCLLTGYISFYRLKEPQILLDWVALVFAGLTTGTIAFFVVWGHFQQDPVPPARSDAGNS